MMGIYRGIWGTMSSNDTLQFLKAATLATILSVVAVTFIYRFVDFSKGIFVIDWLLTIAFLLGTRGSFRFFIDAVKRRNLNGARVLIYGAGRGGEILLREILNNEKHKINPVGFIDDDNAKVGKNLQGFPIYGSLQSIEFIMKKQDINGLLISFNHLDTEKLEEIKKFCRQSNLFLKQFSVFIRDLDLDV
jgi:UDP-GlcNAc:undecaprenyl-phosphate GlcNAc-1-phosphate transferase